MSDSPQLNLDFLTGPVLPGSTTSTETSGNVSSNFTLDSVSPSTTPTTNSNVVATVPLLEPGTTSLSDFMRAVNTSINQFKTNSNASDNVDDSKQKEAWLDAATLSSQLVQFQGLIQTLLDTETNEYQTIQQQLLVYVGGPLADYNGTLDTTSAAMLQIYNDQQTYINNPITPASTAIYNGQIAAWNQNLPALNQTLSDAYTAYSAATTGTGSINADIDTANTAIKTINKQREALGITDLKTVQSVDKASKPATLKPIPSGVPSSPTNPAGFTDVPIPTTDIISTDIDIDPISPDESAFFSQVSGVFTAVNKTIDALNAEYVSTFSHTQAMEQAIQAFQAGGSQQDYDTAVATYQAYAATENTTLATLAAAYTTAVTNYNDGAASDPNSLAAINAQIATFNGIRSDAGDPLIPPQPPIPVGTNLLLPTNLPTDLAGLATFSFPSTQPLIIPSSPAGSATPTSTDAFLGSFFNDISQNDQTLFQFYVKNLSSREAYRDYLIFILRGLSNVNNSYIHKSFEVTASNQSNQGSVGTGAGLTTSIVGLSSPNLSSTLSQSILTAAQTKLQKKIAPATIGALTNLATNGLANASLASAVPSLAQLSGHSDAAAAGGTAAKTVFAQSFLSNGSAIVDSSALNSGVESVLSAAGFSQAEIAQLSGPVTGGLQLGILQTGIHQVAQALGLPGLLNQVIGNSVAGPSVTNGLASSAGYGLNDVINNPASISALKQKILNSDEVQQIVGNGTWSPSTAENLVNSAVNKFTGRNEYLNNFEFSTRLLRGFKGLGVDDGTAAKLVDTTQDFVRSEQLNRDLDTTYVQQSVNQQSTNTSLNQNQDAQDALTAVNNNQVNTQTSVNSDYSKRQLRDDLIAQLQIQGNTLQQSRASADQVLESLRSDNLKNSLNVADINTDQLNASLVQGLISNGTESSTAQQIASSASNKALSNQTGQTGQSTGQALNAVTIREALVNALITEGIATKTASDIAAKTAITLNNVDPLKDVRSSQILDQQTLAETLHTEVLNKLKKSLGVQDATKVADQLVLTLLGPAPATTPSTTGSTTFSPSQNDIVSDQITQPTSVLNQINSAITAVRKSQNDNIDQRLTDDFRKFNSPNVDVFAFELDALDPGKRLFYTAGNMVDSSKGSALDVRI